MQQHHMGHLYFHATLADYTPQDIEGVIMSIQKDIFQVLGDESPSITFKTAVNDESEWYIEGEVAIDAVSSSDIDDLLDALENHSPRIEAAFFDIRNAPNYAVTFSKKVSWKNMSTLYGRFEKALYDGMTMIRYGVINLIHSKINSDT